ncbi:MAG: L-seryl-tRNA(Sec) selenium transferase [Chloracidobacterium sp.]|nr:L-seryl-tRNA(Sec) selenium transferase [Chloracidobacterium sp.]
MKTVTELSNIPSVDELLSDPAIAELTEEFGRERALRYVRDAVANVRSRVLKKESPDAGSRESLRTAVLTEAAASADAERKSGLRRVINATGVVIHTNLGRAPMSSRAVEAMTEAAGYSTIEYDIAKGRRGTRGGKVISSIEMLTGAEAAIVVNNCAAAAFLILSAFARGHEVIVSRGELVEIGGDFRIPDVLERSGAVLKEVGTTNRTHLRDYAEAINDKTAVLLKVHPSNFRISGFTKAPETRELAKLAHERGVIFFEDAGSGALNDMSSIGIRNEPVIREIIAAGADLVSFSGDKLLGGPQCGIIAGRRDLVDSLARDPLFRALRVDKTITAALEGTLESYLNGRHETELPVLRMLGLDEASIARRSDVFAKELVRHLTKDDGWTIEVVKSVSAAGGGTSPDAELATAAIAFSHSGLSEGEIESRLRLANPPVIARIDAGRVLIDLRTVSEEEEAALLNAIIGQEWEPK